MNDILAITGLTGKKSGGYTLDILIQHKEEVQKKFAGGIIALVRSASNTSKLDDAAINFEKHYGELDGPQFLEEAFQNVDTILNIARISFSKCIVDAAVSCHVRRSS